MSNRFDYIITKIKKSEIGSFPFEHIKILDFFNKDDFDEILASPEIRLRKSESDEDLFNNLFSSNYRVIKFPGCIDDHEEYISWHQKKEKSTVINTSCEGFGVVLRLDKPVSDIIIELNSFLNSNEFIEAIASKFNVKTTDCTYDAGIQKYLDGYEISPHPDIRRKALTYMVNINPCNDSELKNHHTSYLSFKDERDYVSEFWRENDNVERCWVPWEWCNIEATQPENNSIVIFSPNNKSMHAVKADYEHLNYQRTQLYGNLWYKDAGKVYQSKWEDYDNRKSLSKMSFTDKKVDILTEIKSKIPRSVRQKYTSLINKNKTKTHSERKF